MDLNPIRAGIARSPERSEFTCVQKRITAEKAKRSLVETIEQFAGNQSEDIGLPFLLADYLELVDWTGMILRDDKRGSINKNLPPILERLGFERSAWNKLTTSFESQFTHWVGQEETVKAIYKDRKYQRIPSVAANRLLLG